MVTDYSKTVSVSIFVLEYSKTVKWIYSRSFKTFLYLKRTGFFVMFYYYRYYKNNKNIKINLNILSRWFNMDKIPESGLHSGIKCFNFCRGSSP